MVMPMQLTVLFLKKLEKQKCKLRGPWYDSAHAWRKRHCEGWGFAVWSIVWGGALLYG